MADKHYLAEKDKVLLVDKKLTGTNTWANYESSDVGKIPKIAQVGTTGVYTLQLLEGTPASPTWSDVTSKPFDALGAGTSIVSVTESGSTVNKLTTMHYEILDITTHAASATYKNTIALVAKTTAGTNDAYTEYACVRTSAEGVTPEVWVWEKYGDASIDQTTSTEKIIINGEELKFASYTSSTSKQCGIISGDDYNTFNSKQEAIPASETTDKPQVVITTNNAGSVAKRDIATASTDITATATEITTGKAVYEYSAPKSSNSTESFSIGRDANGPFIEY